MTATATKPATDNGAGTAVDAGPVSAPEGNVHQRKLRVMHSCASIGRDASYMVQNRKVEYVSITHLCDSLRKFCVAEGLDLNPSIADGLVTIELVNAANPEERIVSTWPVVDNDRGWSYSIKYALIRLFLIGDGEESEQAGADNSAATASAQTRAPQTGRQAAPQGTESPGRASLLHEVMAMEGGARMTVLQSFGYRSNLALNAWINQLDADVADKLAHAIRNDGDVDPDDIPF